MQHSRGSVNVAHRAPVPPCPYTILACTISSRTLYSSVIFLNPLSIKLYSVSKLVGSKRFQRTIAKDVTWTIEPRSRYVILSNQPESLAVFLNVIAGLSVPTEGWVKHVGRISPPGGFLRYSVGGTPLELIKFLAPLYQFDAEQVLDFVAATVKYERLLRTPMEQLPAVLKRELNFILTYAIPCEYYFYGTPRGCRPEFQKVGQQVLARRSKEATMLLGTGSEHVARSLGAVSRAAILYRGNFTLYERLDDALVVFAHLEPEPTISNEALEGETHEEDVDFLL